ncbi:hypothetical protein Hanom_Chr14g01289821 [Helianthus anomalus]
MSIGFVALSMFHYENFLLRNVLLCKCSRNGDGGLLVLKWFGKVRCEFGFWWGRG